MGIEVFLKTGKHNTDIPWVVLLFSLHTAQCLVLRRRLPLMESWGVIVLEQLPWSYFWTPGTVWCFIASTRIFQLGMGFLANYRSRRQATSLPIFLNCLLSKHGVLLVFLSFLILIFIRDIINKNSELQVNFPKLAQQMSLYLHWITDLFPTLSFHVFSFSLCIHSFIHQTFIEALLCSRHWESKVNKHSFMWIEV